MTKQNNWRKWQSQNSFNDNPKRQSRNIWGAHIAINPFTILQALLSSGGQSANLPIVNTRLYPILNPLDIIEWPKVLPCNTSSGRARGPSRFASRSYQASGCPNPTAILAPPEHQRLSRGQKIVHNTVKHLLYIGPTNTYKDGPKGQDRKKSEKLPKLTFAFDPFWKSLSSPTGGMIHSLTSPLQRIGS